MTEILDLASVTTMAALVESAVRTTLLAAVVGAVLAAGRFTSARLRLRVWTVVLAAAMLMPFAERVLPALRWPAPFAEPVRQAWWVVDPPMPRRPPSRSLPVRVSKSNEGAAAAAPSAAPGRLWSPAWRYRYAVVLYGVVVAALLGRAFIGWWVARRFERGVRRIDRDEALQLVASLARSLGLRAPPRLLESSLVRVPIAMSVWRPSIVLPADWPTWDASTLREVLTHELAHVARRDVLAQRMAVVYRALTWFSPLSWWLPRRLSNLAEQASDEAVLAAGADPAGYARTLLRFVAAVGAQPGRADWHAAMARAGQSRAEQRLERILAWAGPIPGARLRRAALAVAVAFVPSAVLIATLRPVSAADLDALRSFAPLADRVPAATSSTLSSLLSASDAPAVNDPRTSSLEAVASPLQTTPETLPPAGQQLSAVLPTPNPSGAERASILLFDESMPTEDFQRAVASSRRWVAERTAADVISILSIGATMRVWSVFTNDRAHTSGALDRLASLSPPSSAVAGDALLRALRTICDNVRSMPQPKEAFVFSAGWLRSDAGAVSMRDAMQACDRANVRVDEVDPRGVLTIHGTSMMRRATDRWSLQSGALEQPHANAPAVEWLDYYKSRLEALLADGYQPTQPEVLAVRSSIDEWTRRFVAESAVAGPGLRVLRPGDSLHVAYKGAEVLNTDVTVRPDGRISLPLIGDVGAADLTVGELHDRLVSAYKKFNDNPVVMVVVMASPAPATGLTLGLVAVQPGLDVHIIDTSNTAEGAYVTVRVRNESQRTVRSVTLAATIHPSRAFGPAAEVITSPPMGTWIPPHDFRQLELHLIPPAEQTRLTGQYPGGQATLGIVRVDYTDGTSWTYDLKSKGRFDGGR